MISLRDFFLDFPRILADLVSGYNLFVVFRYNGGLIFYPDIGNNGSVPAYRLRIETFEDGVMSSSNVYSVLHPDKSLTPKLIQITQDDKEHTFLVKIKVLFSVHRNKSSFVSGFSYKWNNEFLLMDFMGEIRVYKLVNGTLHQTYLNAVKER